MGSGSALSRGWRPFWLHQVGEYLLGFVLISVGVQSLEPTVPVLAGGLIVVNAALVDGPLGAFRAMKRRQHRIFDVVVMAVLLLLAVLPVFPVDNATRLIMLVIVGAMLFLWLSTNFAERPVRPTGTVRADRSESIGRTAGRLYSRTREIARKQQVD